MSGELELAVLLIDGCLGKAVAWEIPKCGALELASATGAAPIQPMKDETSAAKHIPPTGRYSPSALTVFGPCTLFKLDVRGARCNPSLLFFCPRAAEVLISHHARTIRTDELRCFTNPAGQKPSRSLGHCDGTCHLLYLFHIYRHQTSIWTLNSESSTVFPPL